MRRMDPELSVHGKTMPLLSRTVPPVKGTSFGIQYTKGQPLRSTDGAIYVTDPGLKRNIDLLGEIPVKARELRSTPWSILGGDDNGLKYFKGLKVPGDESVFYDVFKYVKDDTTDESAALYEPRSYTIPRYMESAVDRHMPEITPGELKKKEIARGEFIDLEIRTPGKNQYQPRPGKYVKRLAPVFYPMDTFDFDFLGTRVKFSEIISELENCERAFYASLDIDEDKLAFSQGSNENRKLFFYWNVDPWSCATSIQKYADLTLIRLESKEDDEQHRFLTKLRNIPPKRVVVSAGYSGGDVFRFFNDPEKEDSAKRELLSRLWYVLHSFGNSEVHVFSVPGEASFLLSVDMLERRLPDVDWANFTGFTIYAHDTNVSEFLNDEHNTIVDLEKIGYGTNFREDIQNPEHLSVFVFDVRTADDAGQVRDAFIQNGKAVIRVNTDTGVARLISDHLPAVNLADFEGKDFYTNNGVVCRFFENKVKQKIVKIDKDYGHTLYPKIKAPGDKSVFVFSGLEPEDICEFFIAHGKAVIRLNTRTGLAFLVSAESPEEEILGGRPQGGGKGLVLGLVLAALTFASAFRP